MRIQQYDQNMAADLTAFYNETIAELPHCFPVGCNDFGLTAGGKLKHTRRLRRLEPDSVFVAVEEGLPVGFVHVSPENTRTGQPTDRGVIRFLLHKRGYRRAGQALLDEAHGYLAKRGIEKISAFQTEYRYPFYHQLSAGISDQLDHVQALLYANNYQRTESQVHFEWENFNPVEPELPNVDLKVEVIPIKSESERQGLHLKAYSNGTYVGECGCDPYVETRNLPELQDWFYIGWLEIEEPYQGNGLGKHLLRRAFKEMHSIGYRNATLSCAENNGKAFTLYSNYGFRVFDRTGLFERSS